MTRGFPHVVYSTPAGEVAERRAWRALDVTGRPLERNDLIPLPEGATLSMLPQRLAVGHDAAGVPQRLGARHGWALAALLPIGYTRTHLPGYANPPDAQPLPFFGYTAVAGACGPPCLARLNDHGPRRLPTPPCPPPPRWGAVRQGLGGQTGDRPRADAPA